MPRIFLLFILHTIKTNHQKWNSQKKKKNHILTQHFGNIHNRHLVMWEHSQLTFVLKLSEKTT